MNGKVRWGILGVAKIAVDKVIPAMQRGDRTEVVAIASRNAARSKQAAASLGIPRAYGSYEELLADSEVEVIYNPLPNHLHVPWSIKAAESGKHVLCEKPISLTSEEAERLIAARDRTGAKVQEAFMVRAHPQWAGTRDLIQTGRIGALRAVSSHFSYFNEDPRNIRNSSEYGGGALMDIGCYPIHVSRFLFDQEPRRVMGLVERDARFGTDRLTSAIMDFPAGQAVFTCSTQAVPYQRVQVLGTRGRIEVEIPFNAPPERGCRILVDDGSDVAGGGIKETVFDACNQYTLQADLFSKAVRENTSVALPLEDALSNMRVIQAVFRSAESGHWEVP